MKAKYLIIPLGIAKSFFMAVTQVAWGLSGLILIKIFMTYAIREGLPIYMNDGFLIMQYFIVDYMVWFVWVFFAYYLYFEIKEFI